MARLKGMDTWMWIVGGIVITLLCFVMFLEIFSSLTIQNHTQISMETSEGLATDVNKLCSMGAGQGLSKTLKLSTLVTEFFASDNETLSPGDSKTYGTKLCINSSGIVSCQDLKCPLEMDSIIEQKKVLNFLDRLRGELTFREYDVNLIRTKCGVSVLLKGSSPGCLCGSGDFKTPMYCNYNGEQPLMLVNNRTVIMTDAQTWIAKNESESPDSSKLYSNIADYLGGKKILIIFEDNETNPASNVMGSVITNLLSKGFLVDTLKHTTDNSNSPGTLLMDYSSTWEGPNFLSYNQVWLITPGFCQAQVRNCTDYARWTVNERKNLVNFAKSGGGLLIVTDAAMTKGVYDNVDVSLVNTILKELELPYEQVLSCVCGCDGIAIKSNDTIIENHTLTKDVTNITVIGAAVFKETCTYSANYVEPKNNASCGPDGFCAKGCPKGDPDCSCLEENGYLCKSKIYCSAPSVIFAHADSGGICCSKECYLKGTESCPETGDVPQGSVCLCTPECMTNLTCDTTKHCCPTKTAWNGTDCAKGVVCSSDISQCYGQGHWEHYGAQNFFSNVGRACECKIFGPGEPQISPQSQRCFACDYVEVCQSPVIKPIAEEIVNCCNSKCSDSGGHGSCMQYCSNAVSNSGLSSTENENTLKKCYGLYAIYGMGPAASWTQGYQIHIEAPASVMLSSGTWMCSGYSLMLTTIMRSVGYTTSEIYSVGASDHEYNIVKFPGDTRYTIADTVGNRPSPVKIGSLPGGYPHCSYISNTCGNDAGMVTCPAKSNVYGCG